MNGKDRNLGGMGKIQRNGRRNRFAARKSGLGRAWNLTGRFSKGFSRPGKQFACGGSELVVLRMKQPTYLYERQENEEAVEEARTESRAIVL